MRGIFLRSPIGQKARKASSSRKIDNTDSVFAALKEALLQQLLPVPCPTAGQQSRRTEPQEPLPSVIVCLNGSGAQFADVVVLSPNKLVLVSCKVGHSTGVTASEKDLATLGSFNKLCGESKKTQRSRQKYVQLLVEFCLDVLRPALPPAHGVAAAVEGLRRVFTAPATVASAGGSPADPPFKVEFVVAYGREKPDTRQPPLPQSELWSQGLEDAASDGGLEGAMCWHSEHSDGKSRVRRKVRWCCRGIVVDGEQQLWPLAWPKRGAAPSTITTTVFDRAPAAAPQQ